MLPKGEVRCRGIKRIDSTFDNQVVCPKRRQCQRWLDLINHDPEFDVADYMCGKDFEFFISSQEDS